MMSPTNSNQGRTNFFLDDYYQARAAFKEAARDISAQLQCATYQAVDLQTDPLTVDWAEFGAQDAKNLLLITTGLHGVEGHFGSAVILQFCEWLKSNDLTEQTRVVLVHALNPIGYVLNRRVDANNIDCNRNFLLADQKFNGSPDVYQAINSFLNPQRSPSKLSLFYLQAVYYISRYGFAKVKEAIAGGQFDFERGLFFGGREPSQTQNIVQQHWSTWLESAERVLHLDFHTGLGDWATYKLLSGPSVSQNKQTELDKHLQHTVYAANSTNSSAYQAKGGFGDWAHQQSSDIDYIYFCVEFGTYGPLQMLLTLRDENSLHHWQNNSTEPTHWAKKKMKEAFCPASVQWRNDVLQEVDQLFKASFNYLFHNV